MTDEAMSVAAEELRQFIARIEHSEAEKADICAQIKETYAEAKGRGYDATALRQIVALRRKDKDELAEQEAVLEIYKSALGMG